MGGIGSGRYARRGNIEKKLNLNIRLLKRKGFFPCNTSKIVTWSKRGQLLGAVSAIVAENKLILAWEQKGYRDTFGQHKESEIAIERVPSRWGGVLYWLKCPICGKRFAILYLSNGEWMCRSCADLAYPSETQTPMERLSWKARKIKDKLGGKIGEKPKGMHWHTYERLLAQYIDADEKSDELYLRMMQKIGY